jgi:hypothetical protein
MQVPLSSRFLFSGVVIVVAAVAAKNLGALGVRSRSRETLRLGFRLDGVCGAALPERASRSLLYSLYFCAAFVSKVHGLLGAGERTNGFIVLDVVPPRFTTLVRSRKLLLPSLQVHTQCVAALLKLGIAHGGGEMWCSTSVEVGQSKDRGNAPKRATLARDASKARAANVSPTSPRP